MSRSPGERVRVELAKWGGAAHWAYDAVWLGEDEYGEWLGFAAGTRFSRPGRTFVGQWHHVGLVPALVCGSRPWHLATFYTDDGMPWASLGGAAVEVYVDMTTPAEWDGDTLRAVDLDLDVVRGFNGQTIVDDEDEFAQHRVELGYPDEVVAATRASCDEVLAEVSAGNPPFDGSHRRWHDALVALHP